MASGYKNIKFSLLGCRDGMWGKIAKIFLFSGENLPIIEIVI